VRFCGLTLIYDAPVATAVFPHQRLCPDFCGALAKDLKASLSSPISHHGPSSASLRTAGALGLFIFT
jgi:hypothetical protein